jgi:hypothetical protein
LLSAAKPFPGATDSPQLRQRPFKNIGAATFRK